MNKKYLSFQASPPKSDVQFAVGKSHLIFNFVHNSKK